MENESIGKRGMGINYKGCQGHTKRAVVLQEEEEDLEWLIVGVRKHINISEGNSSYEFVQCFKPQFHAHC
jgi:uncharacterized protein YwlG (UPF0340 family)